jgi:CubicO group peptidase (beta-lactamase class C family)
MKINLLRSAYLSAAMAAMISVQVWADNLSYATPESVGMSSERLDRIAPALKRYIDDGQLVGVVSMVARKGEIVHFEEYGVHNKETGQSVAKDSIFRIYSMTKPILRWQP